MRARRIACSSAAVEEVWKESLWAMAVSVLGMYRADEELPCMVEPSVKRGMSVVVSDCICSSVCCFMTDAGVSAFFCSIPGMDVLVAGLCSSQCGMELALGARNVAGTRSCIRCIALPSLEPERSLFMLARGCWLWRVLWRRWSLSISCVCSA